MRWPILLVIAVAAGCAQVRDPQGGPQDKTPPRLLQAIPPDGSTNFTAQRIVLRFDERVKLDRVRERVLISPPLSPAPDVVLGRSNEVHILLRSPLAPNTTYLFNIGEAVADLTESNAASGLRYVVSTGPVLDSLQISGRVVEARSGAAAAKVLVLAHAVGDTSDLARGRPAYFTRSDSAGGFVLPYLRAGAYHITALVDKNANYRYDLPNEDIAFADSAMQAGGRGAELRLFRERPTTQQANEAKVQPDRSWRLALAKPSAGTTLQQLDRDGDHLTWTQEWNNDRDTVLLWPSDTAFLQGQHFALLDDGVAVDTIVYRASGKMPFNLSMRVESSGADGATVLRASRPLQRFDDQRARVLRDSTSMVLAGRIDSSDQRRFLFTQPPLPGSRLELLPGAFTDRYGGTNDTLRLAMDAESPEKSGTLILHIRTDTADRVVPGPWLLQLTDAQGRTVRQIATPQLPIVQTWTLLPAGSYQVALVLDRNGDGRWTTGNWRSGLQPEAVFHDPDRIDLRAGWEMDLHWVLKP